MKTKNLFLMVITALLFTILSCGKKGDPGAIGKQGSKGDKGDSGATGVAGATGTSNVIYSDWSRPTNFISSTSFGLTHFDAAISASKITQAVLDNSVIIVYGKLLGYSSTIWPTTQVAQMPIVLNYVESGLGTLLFRVVSKQHQPLTCATMRK